MKRAQDLGVDSGHFSQINCLNLNCHKVTLQGHSIDEFKEGRKISENG